MFKSDNAYIVFLQRRKVSFILYRTKLWRGPLWFVHATFSFFNVGSLKFTFTDPLTKACTRTYDVCFILTLYSLSFCHKLCFYNIFATQCRRHMIFHTKVYVRSNSLSLKYLRFSLSGFKDIGIGKFEFATNSVP